MNRTDWLAILLLWGVFVVVIVAILIVLVVL